MADGVDEGSAAMLGSAAVFIILFFAMTCLLQGERRGTPTRESNQQQNAISVSDMRQREHVARVFRVMATRWWELK